MTKPAQAAELRRGFDGALAVVFLASRRISRRRRLAPSRASRPPLRSCRQARPCHRVPPRGAPSRLQSRCAACDQKDVALNLQCPLLACLSRIAPCRPGCRGRVHVRFAATICSGWTGPRPRQRAGMAPQRFASNASSATKNPLTWSGFIVDAGRSCGPAYFQRLGTRAHGCRRRNRAPRSCGRPAPSAELLASPCCAQLL